MPLSDLKKRRPSDVQESKTTVPRAYPLRLAKDL
jgi:hypothetical protein